MAGAGFKDFAVGEVLTASDVDTYLMQQSVMRFADAAARGSALGTATGTAVPLAEGMVSYLDDANTVEVFDGTAWEPIRPNDTYLYAGTRYYTSSGTFEKADPLGTGDIELKAIRVTVIGAGGGSGGIPTTGGSPSSAIAGSGGGGGGARVFITNIAGLSTSETVTVGSGGSGGSAGATSGSSGGSSVAFSVTATGGGGGESGVASGGEILRLPGAQGSASGTFDIELGGSAGGLSIRNSGRRFAGEPGSSAIGSDTAYGSFRDGVLPGQGGRAPTQGNDSGADPGSDGADGIVIVDCFV